MPQNKQHTKEVTERFLQEVDRLVGFNRDGKITLYEVAEKVGISSNNINRLRKSENNYVTIEACCRLCEHYGTDPAWLLMGVGKSDTPGKTANNLVSKLEAAIKRLERLNEKTNRKIK